MPKKPRKPRIERETLEMFQRLRVQVRLLGEHIAAVEQGDREYLGEVATKLRLLVCGFPANTPLLFEMMAVTGIRMGIVLRPGRPDEEQPPLDQWLGGMAMFSRLPTGEGFELTRVELIRAWAEQAGGAHEDWGHDERLKAAFQDPIFLNGIQVTDHILLGIGRSVHSVANGFIREVEKRLTTHTLVKRQNM